MITLHARIAPNVDHPDAGGCDIKGGRTVCSVRLDGKEIRATSDSGFEAAAGLDNILRAAYPNNTFNLVIE